jgi:hypothetical protein
MQKQYYKDGRIKFSSETETSEYESEVAEDRLQQSVPAPPKIVQELKDFRLMEGSDATFVCRQCSVQHLLAEPFLHAECNIHL